MLLLVDASLPPQPVDADCARWLADCEVPFAICFTKCDADKRDGPSSARYVGQLNWAGLERLASCSYSIPESAWVCLPTGSIK